MAVQFILGRSGTGKTSYCIDSIIRALVQGEEGAPLVLLVPEQATYQAQRAILAAKKIAGYSRLRVLSFERLSFWLTGKHTARPEVSRIGREMIIHKILRANCSELTLLGQTAQTPGLAAKLAEVIIEMYECAFSASDASQLARDLAGKQPHNLTAAKFADIALIFDRYAKFISGRFADPDIQLKEALKKVPQADFLSGAKLWVDGFADFTVQQQRLLLEMLKAASDSYIALCLDPHAIDPKYPDQTQLDDTSLFGPTERTFADLTEAVRKYKLPLAQPILLDRPLRFAASPALAHVESSIPSCRSAKPDLDGFNPTATPVTAGNDIHIVSTANRRAEIKYIAGRIVELVRDRNYRFRDIAVIASDISSYQHYIEAIFSDYNIPFFIDKPKSLSTHPVIELITSASRAVTNGLANSDVFTFLKTGLTDVEQSDVDLLENYCLAFGIDANDWSAQRNWAFAPQDDTGFDNKVIDQIRRKAIEPLSKLRDDLQPDSDEQLVTADKFTRAVWDFLKNLKLPEKLSRWSQDDPADRPVGARPRRDRQAEDRQLYDKLVDLFDELDEIFGGELMSVQDWTTILSTALAKLALKLIPPTLDQVLVGSIERSRHPDLKAVFCAGATQKQFPEPVSFDSLLTDEDKIAAEAHGFVLAQKAVQKLTNRQYLAYIAFTRPSQYLCITYPLTTDSGTPALPSPLLDNLKSLFVDLADRPARRRLDTDNVEDARSQAQLTDLLCAKLGKASDLPQSRADTLLALVEGLNENDKLARLGRQVKYAVSYENSAALDKNFADEFYGDSIECSATRLGNFAACPYQHFARYVLDLQQRKQFALQPLDLGRFYHRVLDGLFKRLKKLNKDFATASDKELQNACTEVIAATIETDTFLSNFKKRSRHNAYLLDSATDILTQAVGDYAQMAKAGGFRQIASELAFGKNARLTPRISFSTPEAAKVGLKGIIDRIDCANINGRQVALIFDYKRRPQSFSWSRLYYALDMQLAVYMLAMTDARIASRTIDSVAGAFYIPVETAPSKGTIADTKHEPDKFTRKAKGIFNGQFADALHSEFTPGRWDQFYNFFTTKGEPYGHFVKSGALKPDQFQDILEFAKSRILQLATHITSGRIDITPYRLGDKSPCSYCDYRAVCKFDWQINDYNPLAPAGKEEVLKQAGG